MTACIECPRPGVYAADGKFYCVNHAPADAAKEAVGYALPEDAGEGK